MFFFALNIFEPCLTHFMLYSESMGWMTWGLDSDIDKHHIYCPWLSNLAATCDPKWPQGACGMPWWSHHASKAVLKGVLGFILKSKTFRPSWLRRSRSGCGAMRSLMLTKNAGGFAKSDFALRQSLIYHGRAWLPKATTLIFRSYVSTMSRFSEVSVNTWCLLPIQRFICARVLPWCLTSDR